MTKRAAGCGAALSCAGAAFAGSPIPPPNYGHSFVTVGAPGNRPAWESERIYGAAVAGFPNLGQVNYEYRIDRLETTTQQWFAFVNAAWPVHESLGYGRQNPEFVGNFITATNTSQSAPPNYFINQGTSQLATSMSFRFAAWYCNWSHNGRPTVNVTADTFLTGAYTIDGNSITRSPGALYWIPSLDEWTKATYYDPNRYGAGEEGYWKHPGRSDVPLVGGPPGTPGAQTSGGGWWSFNGGVPRPNVGSYPDVQSPWGLLDTSGGVTEWTDTIFPKTPVRIARGQPLSAIEFLDEIDYTFIGGTADSGFFGLRLASAVPSPASGTLLVGSFVILAGRRRRM